ncbi:MAG: hypothetical protein IPH18_00020 [Chitinophagaceae bacterium]|nr:hypothetical protein [Chitinophagaceae bacterium]
MENCNTCGMGSLEGAKLIVTTIAAALITKHVVDNAPSIDVSMPKQKPCLVDTVDTYRDDSCNNTII